MLLRLALTACAALALVPATASAATLYVADGGAGATCSVVAPCTLDDAIARADADPGSDLIQVLGPIERSQPVDLSRSPIELAGSGTGATGTLINSEATALKIGPGSAARGLRARSVDEDAVELAAGGTLRDADVSGGHAGVLAIGGPSGAEAVLENVIADAGPSGWGVNVGYAKRVSIRSSTIKNGLTSFWSYPDIAVTRSKIGAVILQSGHARFVSSLVEGSIQLQWASTADVLGSTVTGAVTLGTTTRNVPTLVQASIVRGGLSTGAQQGSLVARSSIYPDQGDGVTDAGGNTDADPLFADEAAGDYRLRAGSPAIDREAASRAAVLGDLDLGGVARVTDGDGDGVALPDAGAFESEAAAPPAQVGSGPTPPPAATTQPTPPSSKPKPGVMLSAATVDFNSRGVAKITVAANIDGTVTVIAKVNRVVVGRGTAKVTAGRMKRISLRWTSAGKRLAKRGKPLANVPVSATVRP